MSGAYLPGDTRQRIQDLIKDSSITQAELAGIIGLSESALSRYLKGQTEMLGDGYIIKIAKHFNVSTDFLLGETDIPDRKNYDIEELGISVEAAKLLYTGRLDSRVLNLLLENPHFPQLLALLARYQKEIVRSGIAAMNQQLTFINSLLLEQAESVPDSAGAATQLAADLRDVHMPVINADTTAIQNLFMLIVRDIKEQGETIAADSNAVTAQVLQRLREELSKGQDSLDLRRITAEDLTGAVMRAVSIADIPEDALQGLGSAFKTVLDEMRNSTHDE
ncbi:helix-turn-helix domain-containing protein [Porcincola intestinalis]|uniref:Helix-turn-helix transcriptional regulator n=1 Tax=Porcincola intestinalis TaxID=2606632 RepID=A0A6L5X7S9_9FIRM|nr:helix-turn-helix transcriptional regulator [Porcincola intestinalis]MSS14904.1 helix-turn-helix transcriptional regulator [Porcincola intestinalis]